MLSSTSRPPLFQSKRSPYENLPRIEEENSKLNHRSQRDIGRRQAMSNISKGQGPRSQSLPQLLFCEKQRNHSPLDDETLTKELTRLNTALEERCMVYESMIATLYSEGLSYRVKAADALQDLETTMNELTQGKKELMEQCTKMEGQIRGLSLR